MSKLSQQQIDLLNNLAVLQISCGRPNAALPFLHLAHEMAPGEAETCYLLANVFQKLGNYEECSAYITKYEQLVQNKISERALLLKSIISANEGNLSEGKKEFTIALQEIFRGTVDKDVLDETA